MTGDSSTGDFSFFATDPVDLRDDLVGDFLGVFLDADRERDLEEDFDLGRPRLLLRDFDRDRLILAWKAFSTLARCETLRSGSHES